MLVPEGQNAKFGADRLVYGSARGEIFSVPFDSVSLTITGPPVAQRERPRSSVVGHQALSLSRNGTMVYVPRQSFLRRLAIVDRHGSVQPVLEAPVREYDTPVLSPDGSPARLSPGSGSAAAQTETLPIVFQRTPYGVGQNTAAGIATALADLPADGYIIVLQDLGPLSNANRRYFRESIPTWNDFVQHPDYDAFWKRQAFAPWLNRVTVPTLNVAGWWDQEDFFGPIKIYELLEKHDTKNENFLVVGPWNHGGWSRGTGRTLGRIDFGSDTATHYRRNIMATFLAHYLKDQAPRRPARR